MSITLRVFLILCSMISFILCIRKVKQSKLKVTNSIIWIIGSFILLLTSIFSEAVEWLSQKLGFIAPVNFVFLILIGFLLIQVFIDNMRISTLSEKIKDLNHAIALKEYENEQKNKAKE